MLVDRGSLLRKISDRQLMSESINFNSISNMIYGISSMIYGIGASIDISVRSVLRESRPGFPARGHDSEFKRKWLIETSGICFLGAKAGITLRIELRQ